MPPTRKTDPLRRLLAGSALLLLTGACATPAEDGGMAAGASLGARLATLVGLAPAEPEAGDSAKVVARSIWGVVPSAPRRKADLRPAMIKGSAVAVSTDTLLASCAVVGKRARVGLVRHNKYRIARVVDTDPDRRLCTLEVAKGPLAPAASYRSLADLRTGEPVFAFTNRTSAELVLARGWLAGTSASGDPFLETTLALPEDSLSAVLFDARGNLIGIGAAGPTADSVALATPVVPALAPRLANADLGASEVLLASLTPDPRDNPRLTPILFPLDARDDDGPGSTRSTAALAADAVEPAGRPAQRRLMPPTTRMTTATRQPA